MLDSSRVGWALRRLSVMSAPEIAFRMRREIAVSAEHVAVRAGWTPRRRGSPRATPPLFRDFDASLLAAGNAQVSALDEYCDGTIRMFGQAWPLGKAIRWNVDPHTGIDIPLRFGKRLDYRDASTFGDCKTVWEIARFPLAVPLALGFAATRDAKYAEKLASDVDSWLDQCPFGLGPHWVSSLEVALRLIAWSISHELLRAAGVADGLAGAVKDRERFLTSVYEHCHFIRSYLSEHSSANNHLIGELTGLLAGAVIFPFPRSDRWRDYALARLTAEAARQVHPDGVSREQAIYYHLWVLEYLLLAQAFAEHCAKPMPEAVAQLTGRMMSYVLATMDPIDETPPQIGDSDDGRALHLYAWPESNVYRWVKRFAEPNGEDARARLYGQLLGERYRLVMRHVDAPPSPPGLAVFPDGGYVVFAMKACRAVFDVGPFGFGPIAAHAHADMLSVNVAHRGRWWLCDPGTYVYHTDISWRNFFRSTRAHNTVAVDGCEQGEMGGAFLWLRKPNSGQPSWGSDEHGSHWAENEHDGFASLGITHRRRVQIDSSGMRLRIVDRLLGSGVHRVTLGFQLHPSLNVEVVPAQHAVTATDGEGGAMTLRFDSRLTARVLCGEEDPPAGWYSEHLGEKRPAPYLELCAELPAPATLITEIELSAG
jgi:uncharacterized heparinase superfamily protein